MAKFGKDQINTVLAGAGMAAAAYGVSRLLGMAGMTGATAGTTQVAVGLIGGAAIDALTGSPKAGAAFVAANAAIGSVGLMVNQPVRSAGAFGGAFDSSPTVFSEKPDGSADSIRTLEVPTPIGKPSDDALVVITNHVPGTIYRDDGAGAGLNLSTETYFDDPNRAAIRVKNSPGSFVYRTPGSRNWARMRLDTVMFVIDGNGHQTWRKYVTRLPSIMEQYGAVKSQVGSIRVAETTKR